MALETVRIAMVIPAPADRIYAAWLDSEEHSAMTGSKAVVDPTEGGEHSAWDGYIHGRTLELQPGRRIVQTWRSTDFPLGHSDSRLEVHLLEVNGGTEVALIHTEIPEGQGEQYGGGWRDRYLVPMLMYFRDAAGPGVAKGKPRAKVGKRPAKAAKKVATPAPRRTAKKAAAAKAGAAKSRTASSPRTSETAARGRKGKRPKKPTKATTRRR